MKLTTAKNAQQANPLKGVPYPTAASVLVQIDEWDDVTPPDRANLKAALKAMVRITGKPAEAVLLDPEVLSRTFMDASPAAVGVKASSLNTYRNGLRRILRHLGLITNPRRLDLKLPDDWGNLLAACSDKFLTVRLQRFVTFCASRRISPDQVDDDTLKAYLDENTTRRLSRNPTDLVRRVAAAWNRAAECVPGWPQTKVTAPSVEDRQYSLPFEDYPAPLQQEIKAFRERMSAPTGDSLYVDNAMHRPLRPASINTRLVALRLALGALVQTGVPASSISSLSTLVEPKNLQAILDWHWRRAGKRITDNTGGIGETLRIIAKHHLGLTGPELASVSEITRLAKPPKRSTMTAKNEQILATLEAPQNLARLLHLPAMLMAEARRLRAARRGQEAAWLAGIAVAIEIELRCPMRRENLAHLRIGHDLVSLGGRGGSFTHFMIGGEDVKNAMPINWPIATDSGALIATYVNEFRPLLANAGTDWLFPHRDAPDRPRDPGQFATSIKSTIWEFIGVKMNLHAFRAFAGVQILRDNPGAIEDLRLVLGHRGLETAMAYYMSLQPKAAADRLNALTSRKRNETRSLATAAFAQQGLLLQAWKPR